LLENFNPKNGYFTPLLFKIKTGPKIKKKNSKKILKKKKKKFCI